MTVRAMAFLCALLPMAPGAERGTAVVRGRVTSTAEGLAIRDAAVSLADVADLSAPHRRTTTDASGRFEFRSVPGGTYLLEARSAGLLVSEKGKAPERGGVRWIELEAGQIASDADVGLLRGGVVTGRVVDEAGDPVAGMTVTALAPERVMGKDRLTAIGGVARTDDRGEYRLFGLLPDSYYVLATPAPFAAGTEPPGDEAVGFPLAFHPSSPDPSAAAVVTVSAAQEIAGIDVVVRSARTFELAGLLLDRHGTPLGGRPLTLFPGDDISVIVSASTWTSSEGTFSFPRLPPGAYLLMTDGTVDDAAPLFASEVIHLTEQTPHRVLRAREPGAARGRIVFEPHPPDFAPARLWLTARSGEPGRSPFGSIGPRVVVKPDWTFEVRNVWGPVKLEVLDVPMGWMLKSIEVNGEEATDRAIDLEAVTRGAGTLRVVFTRRLTGIQGRVRDSRGRAAPLADVLAFGIDPATWEDLSRHVKRTTSDAAGRFSLPRLPPGDYHVIAVDHLPEHRWSRVATLESLRPSATAVTIREGEQRTADLTLRDVDF